MGLPKKVEFLMADDIRREEGGKLSVMGIYAGDDIRFPSSMTMPVGIPKLAFLVMIKDGEGSWNAQWSLVAANGTTVASRPAFQLVKQPNTNYTMVAFVAPCVFSGIGKHSFRLELDGEVFRYDFEVRSQS